MATVPQFRTGKEEYTDLKLEFLPTGGGADPHVVPRGHASLASNMLSYPGQTRSRWGLTSLASFAADIRSMKEFVAQDAETRRLITLDALGELGYTSNSAYSWTTIDSAVVEASVATTIRMNSATMFGREHMAFATNGITAAQVPTVWDGTDYRRVAPEGPASTVSIISIGVGNVSIGEHLVRVMFRTKWGFLTAPGPSNTDLGSPGGQAFNIGSIPIGPSYVVGRVLCFTAADDTDFYFIAGSDMDIRDNTTTSVAGIDFTDTELLAGTPVSVAGSPDNDMLSLINLPAQSTCWRYKERLVWAGERSNLVLNGDIGPRGMSFDSGFTAGLPNGWSLKTAGITDGTATVTGEFGGAAAVAAQGNVQNLSLDLSWIPPGVDIRWRARVRRSAGAAAGTLHLILVNTDAAAVTTTVEPVVTGTGSTATVISASELSSSEWRILDKLFVAAANNVTTRTSRFRLAGGGGGLGTAITAANAFYVDYLEMYVASAPTQPSLVRISRVSQPDAYDGLTGYQYVSQDNGQRVITGFELGDTCYYVKERSLHSTRDDGSGEPAFWPTAIVSDRCGSPSAQGVGRGDQWVVIAGQDGLYYFDGGEPVPLQEPAGYRWDSLLDWSVGHKIICRVDMKRKAIYVVVVGVQIYCFQWSGQSPLGQVLRFNPLACMPSGSGTEILSSAISLRSDGTEHFLFSVASGHRIVRIDDSTHTDFGNAIPWNYRTSFYGDLNGAKTFEKMRFFAYGVGNIYITPRGPDNIGMTPYTYALEVTPQPYNDVELPQIRINRTRCIIDFSPNSIANGDYIYISWMGLYWREAMERGTVDRGA